MSGRNKLFVIGAMFTAWSFWWKGEPLSPIAAPELEWSWEFCTPNVLLATFRLSCFSVALVQKSMVHQVRDVEKRK